MFKVNRIQALKIILFGSMFNAFIFNAIDGGGGPLRLLGMLFMNLSGILLLIFFFKIVFKNFDTNFYFKIMFFLLITWCFITVFRAISPTPQTFITVFGHSGVFFLWFDLTVVVLETVENTCSLWLLTVCSRYILLLLFLFDVNML